MTPANVRVYEVGLSDLTAAEIEACCTNALQECRFMPTVADIRAHLKRERTLLANADGNAEWEEIFDSAKKNYSPENCHDPSSHNWRPKPKVSEAGLYALRCIGGWRAVGDVLLKDVPFIKRDFIAHYERFDEMERHNLVSGGEPRRLREPVGGEKLVPMPEEIRQQINGVVKGMP